MKLSAKLITALAGVALLVVALMGSSALAATSPHNGATDAAVYLSNGWSHYTTNPNGFTTTQLGAGSTAETAAPGGTLYVTFQAVNISGSSTQSIEMGANMVNVTVVDPDQSLLTPESTTTIAATSSLNGNGQVVRLSTLGVPASSLPIVDANGDGVVNGQDVTVTGLISAKAGGLGHSSPEQGGLTL